MIESSAENKQEFDDIYSNFHDKIHRYLARLVGEADSEDVTQEVFLKVNAGLHDFRGDSSLSTWIYRIATNAATDYRRKSLTSLHERAADGRLTDEPTCESDIAIDPSGFPDRQLIRKEMNDCIKGIVDGLPEDYRTVLILGDLEELTNNEIAEVLDISIETAKIRLHRARAKLKRELERHCSFYKDERNELACDLKVPSVKFLKR